MAHTRRTLPLAAIVVAVGALVAGGPASAHIRKAVLHVTYVGVATTYNFGLQSMIEQGRTTPPPTLGGVFGTYQARVSWELHGIVPVRFSDSPSSSRIAQRGPAKWTSAASMGRVSVDPTVGCPFGDQCPKPTDVHQQPCSTDGLSMYQPWAKSLSGGRLDAGVKRRFGIFLHVPIDGDAVVTAPDNPCGVFTGGKGNVGPIGFKPPLALNGGPTPKVSPRKLHAYEQALAPFAELRFTRTNQLKTKTFDVDFDWNWKATGNQLGNPAIPAIGQYFSNRITITSHVDVSETRT